jgi:hypothetical protein
VDQIFLAPLVKEAFFSHVCSGGFVKNQMAESIWAYSWIFCFIPMAYVPVFVPLPCWFCYHVSIV